MALSNIWKEPRREITESLIGIFLFIGFVLADYYGAVYLHSKVFPSPPSLGILMLTVPIMIFAFVWVGMLFLFLTHGLGEIICDALADRGLELRPRNRK